MENNPVFNAFNNGELVKCSEKSDLSLIEWNKHPSFEGVYLKDIVVRADTDAQISCHLVKIAPNCKISMHTHPKSTEIHEVICGYGHCYAGESIISYACGTVSILPMDIGHEVAAGPEGLLMFAKFVPAIK